VDRQFAEDRVDAARVGRLATADAGGRPHAVPLCFVRRGEIIYSAVDSKPKRSPRLARLANIEATGRACVLIDAYAEDWSTLWWVRLDGRARIVHDPAEARTAIALLKSKYPQYADQPPAGPVFAIEVDKWTCWSAA
jgi:PPOX class probable F420-dependent enzyme